MKIIQNTPDQLILENNPVWLAVFISVFGLIFLGIGLFTLSESFWLGLLFATSGLLIITVFNLAFSRRSQWIFSRTDNSVRMRRKSLLGYSQDRWELAHLARAVIQTSRSGERDTHRAALVFDKGMDAATVPLTLVYSSGQGAAGAVTAVNTWLGAQKR